jgi:hypothetical protein
LRPILHFFIAGNGQKYARKMSTDILPRENDEIIKKNQ